MEKERKKNKPPLETLIKKKKRCEEVNEIIKAQPFLRVRFDGKCKKKKI